MGRPRKPLAVLEMTGQAAKNPARFSDRAEPETKGPIGDPPAEFLSEYSDGPKLLALWNKLVDQAPVGLLTYSDREYLIAVCKLGVEADRKGSKNYMRALKEYAAALKGLGMTPEGRAIRGLGGKAKPSEATKNPLDSFAQKRKRAG